MLHEHKYEFTKPTADVSTNRLHFDYLMDDKQSVIIAGAAKNASAVSYFSSAAIIDQHRQFIERFPVCSVDMAEATAIPPLKTASVDMNSFIDDAKKSQMRATLRQPVTLDLGKLLAQALNDNPALLDKAIDNNQRFIDSQETVSRLQKTVSHLQKELKERSFKEAAQLRLVEGEPFNLKVATQKVGSVVMLNLGDLKKHLKTVDSKITKEGLFDVIVAALGITPAGLTYILDIVDTETLCESHHALIKPVDFESFLQAFKEDSVVGCEDIRLIGKMLKLTK